MKTPIETGFRALPYRRPILDVALSLLLLASFGRDVLFAQVDRPDRLPGYAATAAESGAGAPRVRAIRLRSQEFLPAGDIAANLARARARRPGAKVIHVIVQVDEIPDNARRAYLQAINVHLLDYLPGQAYFAAVPEFVGANEFPAAGVRWIGAIYELDKMPARMVSEGIGTWALRDGGTAELRLKYFADADPEEVIAAAETIGARVLEHVPKLHRLTVSIPTNLLNQIAGEDWVRWIEEVPPPPTTNNDGSRANVQADMVQAAPYNLSGASVALGIWDGGHVDSTHDDLAGRVTFGDSADVDDHATHVAGTMAGDGTLSSARGGSALQWRGMAPASHIVSYDWTNNITEHNTAINTHGIALSQNSWGWSVASLWGNCSLYGNYSYDAPEYDRIVTALYGEPVSVVFAAGNERNDGDCHLFNGGPNYANYKCIGPPATAKNIITVGAIHSDDNTMPTFSSWGPVDDGRIKPDIVAPGDEKGGEGYIKSTLPVDTYGGPDYYGTSMAAPAASGCISLLVEDYRAQHGGQDPLPSTVKGLLLHTAVDLDDSTTWYNKGPDYASGYGRIQIQNAVDQHRADGFLVGEVGHGVTNSYTLDVPAGTAEVRLTLVWDDPAGAENAAIALVNDLDLMVLDPNGARKYPWTLNSVVPAADAIQTTEDHLNVIEQVLVDTAIEPGTWEVRVVGYNVPVDAPQRYTLVSTPVGAYPGRLGISLPSSATEGDGLLTNAGQVTVSTAPASDLTVSLSSSDTNEVEMPETVIIAAGQLATNFDVIIGNDSILDGSQIVTVTASASNYSSGATNIAVHDNETATLTVTVPPSTTEGQGVITGRVDVSTAPAVPVEVNLSSSDTNEVIVPAIVTIASGQRSSSSFNVTIVDDGRIDGTRTATITAHVENWTDGVANIMVLDNEHTNLVLSLPTQAIEGQGVVTGTVRIAGTLSNDLYVALTSSDPSEVIVPATVTNLAGQTNTSFELTIVNDGETDGAQVMTVTASASGFAPTNAPITVSDDDVHQFGWSAISSPQTAGVSFPVMVTAQDTNGVTVPNWAGSVSLSGAGDCGPVSMTPSNVTLAGGSWTGNVIVYTACSNVQLTVDDGQGHVGQSGAFTVQAGALDHFAWSDIGPTQFVDAPFNVTVTARDTTGNTVTSFTNSVALNGQLGGATNVIGSGTASWMYPMATYYHDARTQVIYPSTELDGPQRFAALALYVAAVPGQTMNNWTIRMKHTALTNYTSASWEDTGWTIVYQSNQTVLAVGWFNFVFSTPFDYNGSDSLMIDFSFNNSYYTTDGGCRYSAAGRNRSLYYRTDSYYGDPLTWSGNMIPGVLSAQVPNIRLTTSALAAISPTNTDNFTNGVWTGEVAVLEVVTNVILRADDGSGNTGDSNPFMVDYLGTLTVAVPTTATEGDGVLANAGLVTVSVAPASDLTVSLSSGDTNEVIVAPQVTITAGELSTNFNVSIVDDGVLDCSQTVIVAAEALGYAGRAANITVEDNETATLTVTIPGSVTEDQGALTGTVTASASPDTDVVVSLSSSDLSEVIVPTNVIIQAGRLSSTNFSLTIVDDLEIDGAQTATITAHVAACTNWTDDVADIMVLDNEHTNLVLSLPTQTIEGQGVVTGTVRIAGTLSNDLYVALTSSDPSEVIVPATVTNLVGQTNTSFELTIVNDGETDGAQVVTVTASASGFAPTNAPITVSDDDVHQFGWSAISSPQTAGVSIPVTVTAQDTNGVTIPNWTGSVSLSGAGDCEPVSMTPSNVTLAGGSWTGNVIVYTACSNVQLTVDDGLGHVGQSGAFTLQPGALDQFAWSDIGPAQFVDVTVNVIITAQDTCGNTVTGFGGPVDLTGQVGSGTASSLVITECDPSLPDFIEIQNVSRQTLDCSGWVVAVSDSYSVINTGNTTYWFLPSSMAPGEVVYRTDNSSDNYWGSNIYWDNGSPGWAMIVDDTGKVVDFVAWAWSAASISGMSPVVNGHTISIGSQFTGDGVSVSSLGTLQRQGDEDENNASDFARVSPGSKGAQNAGLTVPFTGGISPVPVDPTVAGNFVNGVWTGDVAVREVATNMYLRADDGSGNAGDSNPFNVGPLPLLTVEVVSAYGGAAPSTGTNFFPYGADLSFAVTNSPVPGGVGTQYVCVSGAVVGNDFTQVGQTNVTLTLTNNATLTWQWDTQYWLSTATNGSGTVTGADGWYASGSSTVLVAMASTYWHFREWSGDTNGCPIAGNVITVVMSAPRGIAAVFGANDTDGDIIPDIWEIIWCGGPTNCVATDDIDFDTLSYIEEYIADSDPTDSTSFFSIIELTNTGTTFGVRFNSSAERMYLIESTTNILNTGSWIEVEPESLGNDGVKTVIDISPNEVKQYRGNVRVP